MKNFTFFLIIKLLCTLSLQAQWVQIGENIEGEAPGDLSGESISLSADGSVLAIGALRNEGNSNYPGGGHVRVFKNVDGNWSQLGNDINGDFFDELFGSPVRLSADGTVLAAGARFNDGGGFNSGQVRIFENINGNWLQIGNDIDGEAAGDLSHTLGLSSDGTVVAIGAQANDGNGQDSGHVRVYKNQNGNWVQIGNDINGESAGDWFGWSVSISADGTVVAAGAQFNDGNGEDSGHVRVFTNQNDTWVQVGNAINGENPGDLSGTVSLSADGSRLAIGARFNDGNGENSGHVRVFENTDGEWLQLGNDIDGEAAFDNSGGIEEVKLNADGTIVAIGAINNSGNGEFAGHARVFKYQDGSWVQIGDDIDGSEGDSLGDAVSLSADGSVLAVGAPYNKGNGTASGHVRVFENNAILNVVENEINNVIVYPNPTKAWLYINEEGVQKIEVIDISGSLVKVEENTNKVDLANQESGVYVLRIYSAKGIGTIKVILKP